MSSRVDLRASRSLDLLKRLKQTAADFAKVEEQLYRDLAARRYAVNRKFRDAKEKAETRLSAFAAEAALEFQSVGDHLRSVDEGRRRRVERAHGVRMRNLPKRAHEAKERWMGELQMKQFRAERKMTADLEAAGIRCAAYTANLAEERQGLLARQDLARKRMAGYGKLLRALAAPSEETPSQERLSQDQGFEELQAQLQSAAALLDAFQRFPVSRFFSMVPLPVLIFTTLVVGGVTVQLYGNSVGVMAAAGGLTALLLVLSVALYQRGLRRCEPTAGAIAGVLANACRLHNDCAAASVEKYEEDRIQIQAEYTRTSEEILAQWNEAGDVESQFEQALRQKNITQLSRVTVKLHARLSPALSEIETQRAERLERFSAEANARIAELSATHRAESQELDAQEAERWATLQGEWNQEIGPLYHAVEVMNAATASAFPAWTEALLESWVPATGFTDYVKFGQIDVDLAQNPEALPKTGHLPLPGPARLSIPLALSFPAQGSLLFETHDSSAASVIEPVNNIILRLLANTQPGKLSFTIIDPVGLGQNFAGLMHLSDYEESLINQRIWTQRDQIEEKLVEMGEHIEKVIQMYLRNEYDSITEYNAQAGSVAEKYHFLVVADFPSNFSESATKRLQSIALSGPRCGIFTLIHWDQRQPFPDGFMPDELRRNSVCVYSENNQLFLTKEQAQSGGHLVFDAPPEPDLAVSFVHKIGKSSVDSNRVEVPFQQIAPTAEEFWTHDTTQELRIAVGRTGATKLQYLAIGKGTRQHALFAGKTGSGKSTLFHVIITNLALACSPEQVEFYLIDFKKGVEFKCYASKRLPHARVVAIESDREFALSVLQRVDEELKRRGDLFRKMGAQDVAGYKKAGGTEPIPRSLLIIDEFQEFFVEDDQVAQTASLLFDRIVRQGRAFGIHVLLGSQTLGGAYSLARATLGQMVIRVALQCNEADAYLIMDDNNSAPRLLSRPGEGIYNDAAGALAGNSPFQVVWLPDEDRDAWLDKVNEIADQHHIARRSPIVFEGNAPADLRDNDLLYRALEGVRSGVPALPPLAPLPAMSPITPITPMAGRVWLGAPNSIKGPTEAVFQRQSGNHLLIVGQRDEAVATMLGIALLSLAAQYPVGQARFVIFQGAAPGSVEAEFMDRIAASVPHEITVARAQDVGPAMDAIARELKARSAPGSDAAAGGSAPSVFLLIAGLHKFKKLRHEDDFSFSMGDSDAVSNPAAQLGDLIAEGSSQGMHLLVTVDSFNDVNRFISRKALSEFEMRVVFQMSANDSASLIDSPKASNLGLHRAIFFNEHDGTLETFRPYAPPDQQWLEAAVAKLSVRG